jgi:dolichol kinase
LSPEEALFVLFFFGGVRLMRLAWKTAALENLVALFLGKMLQGVERNVEKRENRVTGDGHF